MWKQTHYPPETATIFLLVRMIVVIQQHRKQQQQQLQRARAQTGKAPANDLNDLGSRFAPFDTFTSVYESKDLGVQHKFLAEQFKDNIASLREAVKAALYVPGEGDEDRALLLLLLVVQLNHRKHSVHRGGLLVAVLPHVPQQPGRGHEHV